MATPQPVTVNIDVIPFAVALVGEDGRIMTANRQLVEMLGHDPADQPVLDLVHEDDRAHLSEMLERPTSGGCFYLRLRLRSPMNAVVRTVKVDGGARLAFFEPIPEDDPLDDISAQALEVLGQGFVIGDGTRILSATPSAARLFGRSVEELIEIGSLFSLFEPSEQERFSAIVAECALSGEPMPEHFRTALVHPDGEVWPVDLWVKATVRAGRTRTYTVIADARERAMVEAELAHQATHDHLTGLPNRYLLLDRLDTVLRRLERAPGVDVDVDAGAALYFVDLDDFKGVNDRFGHAAGDHVLRVTAERILHTIRATDSAARIGGDEFVVLSGPDGRGTHEQLRIRLDAALGEPIIHEGVDVSLRASIGICRFSDGNVEADSILLRADRDMYDVKTSRRAS